MTIQSRWIAAGGLLLAAIIAPLSLLAAQSEPLGPPIRPEPIAFDLSAGWKDLQQLADLVRAQSGTPGIALAVVRNGKIVDQAVSGVTSIENGRPLRLDDRFEWGSITKSVTGTVIAHLFADGLLQPQTTIGEVLSELPMREGYRSVTVAQLMRHEGGIPAYTQLNGPIVERLRSYAGSPAKKRLAFATDVLKEEPVGPPGGQFVYSNADIAIAAVMAERVSGMSWEDMVRAYVFAPAGMTTGGFGAPATSAQSDATRGHMQRPGQPLQSAPFGMYADVNPIIGPAGSVHSSIEDFARYAMFHLTGLSGGVPSIPRHQFELIHTPDPASRPLPNGDGRYNYGWVISDWRPLGGVKTIWHNGSNGTFYAQLRLVPERNLAVLILTNSGGRIGVSSEPVLAAMADRYGS